MSTVSINDSFGLNDTEKKEALVVNNSVSSIDEEDEALESMENPFLDEIFYQKHVKLYEESNYECRHRFDPNFKWTKQEQKKLTFKLDLRVTLMACIFFASLQIDRTNLGQAVSDNMLNDLGMTTNDYNNGNTIFYFCFLGAELPAQLISKRLGAEIWIPIQMISWSIVTICQFRLKDKAGFYICRALLGICEGGFIADLILWLSYFYTASELTIRLSFFWSAMYSAQIFNYLIAYGILHMSGVCGHHGWQWLFLIEGLLTLLIGVSAVFLMVASPVQTKRPWNKNGWLSEHEEKMIVNKVVRNDPSKGDLNNKKSLSFKQIYDSLLNWHLWPVYIIGIVIFVPQFTTESYLTLTLRSMGFSVFHTNLLCIPWVCIRIIGILGVGYLSEKIKSIFIVTLIYPVCTIIFTGILKFWSGTFVNQWGSYVVLTLLLGSPFVHAIIVSACSRNSYSIKNRTVSASVYNMFVQGGSIISSNVYRTDDKPLYHRGNAILFGFAVVSIPLIIFAKLFYMYLNHKKEKIWNSMSDNEKEQYLIITEDDSSNRLDFRFQH